MNRDEDPPPFLTSKLEEWLMMKFVLEICLLVLFVVLDLDFFFCLPKVGFKYYLYFICFCTPYNRLSGQQMLSGTQIISTSHGMTGRNFFDVFLPFYILFGF